MVRLRDMRQRGFMSLLAKQLVLVLITLALALALGSIQTLSVCFSCCRSFSGGRVTARSAYRQSRDLQFGGQEGYGGIVAPPAPRTMTGKTAAERKKSDSTLTAMIVETETARDLPRTLANHMRSTSLNSIHLAAAFRKMANMPKPFDITVLRSPTLVDLVEHTERVCERREFDSRHTADLLSSVTKLSAELPGIAARLGPVLAKLVPELADAMSTEELTKTIWSLGMIGSQEHEVTIDKAVAAASQSSFNKLSNFSMTDLKYTARGLSARAAVDEASVALLDRLAKNIAESTREMKAKDAMYYLPDIAVSYVKLGIWHTDLMDNVARRLAGTVRKMLKPKPTFHMKWSLAALAWCWKQPISPYVQSTENFNPEVLDLGNVQSVIENFGSLAHMAAKRRGVTQKDIESAVEGPRRIG